MNCPACGTGNAPALTACWRCGRPLVGQEPHPLLGRILDAYERRGYRVTDRTISGAQCFGPEGQKRVTVDVDGTVTINDQVMPAERVEAFLNAAMAGTAAIPQESQSPPRARLGVVLLVMCALIAACAGVYVLSGKSLEGGSAQAPVNTNHGPVNFSATISPRAARVGESITLRVAVTNLSTTSIDGLELACGGPWDKFTILTVAPNGTFSRTLGSWARAPMRILPSDTGSMTVVMSPNEPGNFDLTFIPDTIDHLQLSDQSGSTPILTASVVVIR